MGPLVAVPGEPEVRDLLHQGEPFEGGCSYRTDVALLATGRVVPDRCLKGLHGGRAR